MQRAQTPNKQRLRNIFAKQPLDLDKGMRVLGDMVKNQEPVTPTTGSSLSHYGYGYPDYGAGGYRTGFVEHPQVGNVRWNADDKSFQKQFYQRVHDTLHLNGYNALYETTLGPDFFSPVSPTNKRHPREGERSDRHSSVISSRSATPRRVRIEEPISSGITGTLGTESNIGSGQMPAREIARDFGEHTYRRNRSMHNHDAGSRNLGKGPINSKAQYRNQIPRHGTFFQN